MILIPLELRRAIAKSEALASIVRGYKGYNNRKYHVYYKKTIAGKTVWVIKKNNKF